MQKYLDWDFQRVEKIDGTKKIPVVVNIAAHKLNS